VGEEKGNFRNGGRSVNIVEQAWGGRQEGNAEPNGEGEGEGERGGRSEYYP